MKTMLRKLQGVFTRDISLRHCEAPKVPKQSQRGSPPLKYTFNIVESILKRVSLRAKRSNLVRYG